MLSALTALKCSLSGKGYHLTYANFNRSLNSNDLQLLQINM